MPSLLSPLRPDELDTRTPVSTDWMIITPTGGPTYKCAVSSISGGGGGSAPTVNAQTGTTYTLALTDANNRVTLSNTSAITLTIPLNSSVNFPTGTGVDLIQLNTGQVTVAAASGVTLNGTPGLKLRARYSGCSLIQVATNSWVMVGDTTP